ncbi:ABC transporter permease [Tomitella fengzijianii]|uniref:FtsX-like permease family protein n=1 Tax=Tomitella fengzijianii TaxID=2597660 RepID=A0A516X5A0_9ACTN|nr:FtsX-like permease family protein [Tomitella fengzijianii]QDQ98234.1 FtsX-like permease family protein [Tomitella fengzijianii]
MLKLSWSTFRERWQLFIGSILTVGFGVALVQSSLLILLSAVGFEPAPGLDALTRAQMLNSSVLAVPVIGITLALGLMLTIVIVSSTFAFTVSQRRKELGLLRLAGASRTQVRRLLLSEAALLGLAGTALGIPLGLSVMRLQSSMLVSFDFLPSGFRPEWQSWVVAVSIAIGLIVALAGVSVASRRAGRVRPLDAVRDTGDEARVMAASRWFFGVAFLIIAALLIVVSQSLDPSGAMPLMMLVALAGAVGLAALSPVVVPPAGRVVGLMFRGHPTAELAAANIRDGVRRSASTAAPLILLVGLVVGLLSTSLALTTASEMTLRRDTTADLVATTPPDEATRISNVPGVASTSVETDVPLVITNGDHGEDELGGDVQAGHASVVDPGDFRESHRLQPVAGSLDALHGQAVALGPGRTGELGFELGDTIDLQIGDRALQLPIVAVTPIEPYGGSDLLLPAGSLQLPEGVAESARTFVSLSPGADQATVQNAIQERISGTVADTDEWVQDQAAAQQNTQLRIFVVLLGLSSLYTLFAAINAVVIAASNRRPELAATRLAGLTRGQTVRMAVLESGAVAAIGIVLGGVAASGTILGMRGALERMTGVGVIEIPWPAVAGLIGGTLLAVGLASSLTARAATRVNPIAAVSSD